MIDGAAQWAAVTVIQSSGTDHCNSLEGPDSIRDYFSANSRS